MRPRFNKKDVWFIFYIISIYFILFMISLIGSRVHAATAWDASQFKFPLSTSFYNCSSYSSCNTSISTSYEVFGDYTRDVYRGIYSSNSKLAIGPAGVSVTYFLDQELRPGFVYSVETLTCTEPGMNNYEADASSGSTNGNARTSNMLLSSTQSTTVNAGYVYAFPNTDDFGFEVLTSSGYCTIHHSIVSPETAGSWFNLHFTRSTVTSAGKLYLVGFNTKNLGILESEFVTDVKGIVEIDGLRTRSQLNELDEKISSFLSQQQETNKKLDEVKDNQQETNNKLNDLNDKQQEQNDYLMDDTAPSSDISSLGNVQGLLPTGPVDSLLNIPFMFLSVVVSSLGSLCVPLQGKWVFDTTLNIACFSDVFYNRVPDTLMIFINTIPTAFILIKYFKHLYKKVDRAISMNSNSDDEWGVI